ncbi:hypothetical protein ACNUCX_06805 [Curtobacterium flaccumfaciens pv. flaccumfaciens]|uniref:hypothetical protein n=1 Tax=Curtobacterium flaccumfaciens TaxID=2035 RepID=UPI003AB895C1
MTTFGGVVPSSLHRELVQHRGEDLVDARCRQSGSALGDVADEVVRTDDVG